MEPINYTDFVRTLVKDQDTINNNLTGFQAGLIHMMMGLAGETGELMDAIKKSVIYGKTLDRTNIIEELGDIEFYLEGLRQSLRISREQVISNNVEKLTKRYTNNTYSDTQAIQRADKDET